MPPGMRESGIDFLQSMIGRAGLKDLFQNRFESRPAIRRKDVGEPLVEMLSNRPAMKLRHGVTDALHDQIRREIDQSDGNRRIDRIEARPYTFGLRHPAQQAHPRRAAAP